MGQAITVPVPAKNLIDAQFVNLRKQTIESLWTSYNLVGECWVGLKKKYDMSLYNVTIYMSYRAFKYLT